jgi:stringent starvation protein B
MKKSAINVLITTFAVSLGLSVATAADKVEVDHLNARSHQVNAIAKTPGMRDTAFHDISVETGVPLDEVRALYTRHPGEGVGGVLIACAISDETKKAPEKFMDIRATGKTWPAIARDNGVRMEKLNDRLDHLEKALNSQEKRR